MHNVVERILNLLAFLLTVDRPVTADEIRHTIAGYGQSSDEAWRRMFERDKDLLRSLGIPLEMRPTDAWEVEHGYVVAREDYSLPDPGLTDEERAALWLAAQVVRMGGQPSGPDALFKLGGATSVPGGEPLAADLGAESDTLGEVFTAVAERRTLGLTYRERHRTLHPYGLVHRRGHWYLVAAEQPEDIIKVFRLERAAAVTVGEVDGAFQRPEGLRPADYIADAPWEAGPEDFDAVVRFDASLAWWAQRQLVGRSQVEHLDDGALLATLHVANPDAFIGWVLGFDSAAVIESPQSMVDRLVERVEAAL